MAERRPTDGDVESPCWWGRTEKIIACILAGTTVAAGAFLIFAKVPIDHKEQSTAPPLAPSAASEEPFVLCPDPPQPAARAAFEAFTEASGLENKAKFVQDAARVLPMMTDYHLNRSHPFPNLSRISKGSLAKHHANPVVLFEVEPYSGPPYPVAMIWDGRRFAVDWESLTAYGTLDWSEYLSQLPSATHTFRVYLQATTAPQQIPGTPPGWLAFRVEHRDNPQPVIALANRSVSAVLSPLVFDKRVPVTLELRWRAVIAARPPVPEIVKLISAGWSP
jgi:hypothetical protein